MVETGLGFFWTSGLELGLDNNNLPLVSVEASAMTLKHPLFSPAMT